MADMLNDLVGAIQQVTDALVQQGAQTQAVLAQTVELMAAPKTIVRDSKGRVVGLKPMVN